MTMPKKRRVPTLRLHKPTNQAFVEIDGRRHYLGVHERPDTIQAYHRLIAEWIAGGYRLPVPQDQITVMEVADAYAKWAESYYLGRFGEPSQENTRIRSALRPTIELYGNVAAIQFGPNALRAVRQVWIGQNISITTVNCYVGVIKRMFKWAASHEMVPASVHEALTTLSGLRRGRGMGKDPEPRQAVPNEHVEATIPHLPGPLQAVVRLLLLTGARPTEILRLQRRDIDTNANVWTAIVREHKTMDKGKSRRLFFGPRAQGVLRPFMLRPDEDYLFSPREAQAERYAQCSTHRRENQKPNPRKTPRVIGYFYEHTGLNKAIARVCKEHNIPKWTPYQLRHLAATTIEATADLETASAILGHSGLNITQVYVHRDNKTAAAWAALHG